MDYSEVYQFLKMFEKHLKESRKYFLIQDMIDCVEKGECPFRCKFCLRRDKPTCKYDCPKYSGMRIQPKLKLSWKQSMEFYVTHYDEIREVVLDILKEEKDGKLSIRK